MASAARSVLVAFFSLVPFVAAEVRIVEPGGGLGTYPTIEDAVQASIDGDVVLVKTGVYQQFFVNGKALSIVADQGANVTVTQSARVVNLPAGKRVLLSGLHLQGTATSSPLFAGRGLTLLDNAGSVRVQSCTLTGADNLYAPPDCTGPQGKAGWPGAFVSNCADVVFVDCIAMGGRGVELVQGASSCAEFATAGNGADAIQATNSRIAIYGGSRIGGQGGNGGHGGHGGRGLSVIGGSLFLAGGDTFGGNGGNGWDFFASAGGNGGHAVLLSGVDPAATGVTGIGFVVGGSPGFALFGGGSGAFGVDFAGFIPTALPGPARRIEFPVPVTSGQPFTVTLSASSQEIAIVLIGLGEGHLPLLPFHGVLHAMDPIVGPIVVLGPGPTGQTMLPTPALPPGVSRVVPLQGAFLLPNGELRLGAVRHQVVLP